MLSGGDGKAPEAPIPGPASRGKKARFQKDLKGLMAEKSSAESQVNDLQARRDAREKELAP